MLDQSLKPKKVGAQTVPPEAHPADALTAQHASAAQLPASVTSQLPHERSPQTPLPHSSLHAILSWMLVIWGSVSLVHALRSMSRKDLRGSMEATDLAMGSSLTTTGFFGLSRSFNRAQLCLATFCQLAFLALEVMCASSMLWRHLPLLVLGLPTLLHMAINRWASEPAGAGERAAGAPEAGGAPQVEVAPPWAEQQQEATAQARKSHAAGLTADAGVGPWPWASSAACAHSGGGGRGTDACVASATSALPGSSFIMESTGSSSRPAFNQWTPPPAKQAAALVLQPPAALPASPAVAAGEAAGVGLVVVNKGDLSGMAQAGPSIFFGGRSFSVSQRGVPTSPSPQNDAAALQALLSAMEREGNMRVGDD